MTTEPLTERGRRTRERLLRSAREVFEQRGFDDTRMSDLTDAAGVSHGTVYTYFESKEAVLRAVCATVTDEVFAAVRVPDDLRTDPVARIAEGNRRYLRVYATHARMLEVVEQAATADDAAYATCELEGHDGEPVVAQLTMSWATRVRRDDLVTFAVDGTDGSAVAGLSSCQAQSRVATPRPVWNPDEKQTMNFFDQWQEIPDTQVYDNGFKIQWEQFIRHVAEDAPWQYGLAEGAKGVQLVEAALESWKERRWVDVPALAV